jgi:hypothetical protein
MQIKEIIKDIQNWFHSLVSSLKPALDYAESAGGEALLNLAEGVLINVAADASWKTIIAAFIPEAEKAGKTLLDEEASLILNLAKANLIGKALTNAPE